MELIRRAGLLDRRNQYIALSAPVVAYCTARLVYNLVTIATATGIPPKPFIYEAPKTRMLTPEEEEQVPYPPDALPGGRNIDTPYGNVRAYEWGPENGRKVLFVHGISTPCIALAKMAKLLVRKGCRVMLFDLFGRGYSDCPDPNLYPQDIRLFSTQILAVLASSSLDWSSFTLCGYSLGGGIAAQFTSHYPELVESLVLVAPGGILRPARVGLSSRLLYSGMLPDQIVNYVVGNRLRIGGSKPKVNARPSLKKLDVINAVQEELPGEVDPHAPGQDSSSPIFDDRPSISPATAVSWQLDTHPGFVPSFVSSLKYAPIYDGHDRWRLIGKQCEVRRRRSSVDSEVDSPRGGLNEGKVLILLGLQDVIIVHDETADDAVEALGHENVKIVKMSGGHDLTLTNATGCVAAMTEFWDGV